MDASVTRGTAWLDDERGDWRALWEQDPAAGFFHLPEYARAWHFVFGEGARIAAVEARDGNALRGLAHVTIGDDGVLRFLGDAEITDYLGPISGPGDRDSVADAFVEAIGELDGWASAELQCLAADAGWAEPLARAAKAHGLDVVEEQQDVCPRVRLPGSYDDYLASIDGKLRHEIRRKGRKLEREAGPYAVRLSTADRLDDDLETFFAMHRSSTGPKGRFLHWGMEGMFKLVARACLDLGWLRLAWIELGGEPWAAMFGFSARGTWGVYNSAFDHSKRELSPGMVLTAETIRLAAEEGCATFDFLRGAEAYKYRFGAVDVPLAQLTLRRP